MAGKRATARMMVDGMSCSSCEQRIEKAVRALQGVTQVSASASLSEVMVYYDGDLVTREAIVGAVSGAGYQVRGGHAQVSPASRAAQDAAAAKSSRHASTVSLA